MATALDKIKKYRKSQQSNLSFLNNDSTALEKIQNYKLENNLNKQNTIRNKTKPIVNNKINSDKISNNNIFMQKNLLNNNKTSNFKEKKDSLNGLKPIEELNNNQLINIAKMRDEVENTDKHTKDAINMLESSKKVDDKKARKEVLSQFAVTPLLALKGASQKLEGAYNTMYDLSSKINEGLLNKTGVISDEEYNKRREQARNYVADNKTENFYNKYNLNDTLEKGEKHSLVKRDNLLGKTVEGVGGMLPTILLSSALGVPSYNPTKASSLKGLIKNIGTHALINAPTNVTFGTSAYGNALAEAYSAGATDEEATKYAISSTAVEIASEWITGGIPGTNGVGGLDILVDKGIDKISNQLVKELVNYGYKMVGEGVEEAIAEILNPILKNATYSSGNEIDWKAVIESAIVGGLTAGVLEAPNMVSNISNDIRQNNNINSNDNTVLPKAKTSNSLSDSVQNNIGNQVNENAYQYIQSDNEKINNLRKSAVEIGKFVNNEKTRSVMNVAEKLISDKNYNIVFDNTLTNDKGNMINAKITTLENGEVEIRINPNSERAGEFLIMHEVTHAIETQSLKELVVNFAKQNKDFDKALTDLKQTYGTEDVSSEVLADISGQLLGNQDFINSLEMQNTPESKNIIKQIYESIVRTLNKLTTKGRYRNFVQDLETKWREAYQTQTNNLSGEIKYHVNKDINKNVDNILKNINERNPVKLRDYTPKILVDNGIKDLPMYENPSHIRKNILTEQEAKQLGLSIGTRDHYHGLGKDIYIKAIDSLDNPRVIFKNKNGKDYLILTMIKDKNNNNIVVPIEIQTETYINRIRIDTNRIKSVYGYEKVNNIDLNEYIKNNLKKQKFQKIYEQKKGRGTGFSTAAGPLSNNNIPQNNKNVKSGTSTMYSMQENINNTQELDNSSFSLKQKQLEIIQNNNPVQDDYHTWIRTIDDIKTFEETLEDVDYKEYYEAGEAFDETYSADIAKEALSTGKITVYSSYPIEQGIFVSPSRMEAESYSGNGKVYSKEVNLTDVAWIDPTQGQYAKVNDRQYSQQNDKWQEHLEKNYKATGTRTMFSEMKSNTTKQNDNNSKTKNQTKKIMNPLEISKITKEDANTTPILKKINVSTGDGESRFASNIKNKTDMLSQSSKDTILSSDDVRFYQKITNQESLEKAFERLNKGGKSETENWLRKESENATSIDVAEGWILLKQYQDSIAKETDITTKNELNRSMVEVAKKLREMGTKAGQTVQAFNILNRLTPEGMVYYAQSELSEAYEKMSQNKTKEWIDSNRDRFELTPEETKFIMDTMQEVQQMEDGYDKRVKLAEIQKLMTDKLPPERGAGIKAWMRISMLFNPKTQVRNVMGNAIIAPVNSFSDLFASIVDKQIAKKTGVRTTGKTNIKNYTKGFKTGLYQSYNDFKKGINTRNMQGNRFEVTEGKSFNDNSKIGKQLNKVDSLLSFMLDAGDRGFYEASFTNSINNQMILNNTTEVTQDMIDIATSEALSRTWQDNNNYTKFVLQTRNALNKINIKGYGLGDVLIPFAKTPANLTKAIVDYSPLGMVNAINSGRNLKNSISNGQYNAKMQHQFVQNLGKATAGTMLYILGYALAKAGITSGESDDDKDTKDFMKNTLGINSYSIKIGNKSFTYDWAQPIAAPLSITANIVNKQKESTTLTENILSSLDTAGNILLEQSFMESINTVLNNNDGIVTGIQEAIFELPSRAIPTLMKQIVDLTDDTQRTTFEYDKPLKTAVNKVKTKIPGLSKTLSPVVDTMGREVKRYGGKNNIFNVFLNPANVNTENISKSAQEIYRVYKSTGDKTVMPRVIPYYFNEDGVKRTLTSKERSQFQKISGEIIEENIVNLINNSNYINMNDIDKSTVLNNLVNYAYNKARYEMFGTEMSNLYNKVNEWTEQGKSVADYYANKEENDYSLENPKKYNTITNFNLSYESYTKYSKEINSIKNQYNDTNSRKNAVWQYIQNQKIPKVQKILLYNLCGGYSISNYKDYMFNYLNNQNISKIEKQEIWKYLYE